MFEPSVRPDFHDVEARVGFRARFHPIKLGDALISALFRLHHRFRGSAVSVGGAGFDFHEHHFVAVLYDEIRLAERRAIIFFKTLQPSDFKYSSASFSPFLPKTFL